MSVLSAVIGTMMQHDSSEMMKNIQVDAHGKAHQAKSCLKQALAMAMPDSCITASHSYSQHSAERCLSPEVSPEFTRH